MDDHFLTAQSAQLFDLSPMGFSPSIDTINPLPMTFDETLDTPFMTEVQRQRADTITMLKPAFHHQASLQQTPKRPRALHRLSLTPSVESSIASTTPSEFDYSGCDSEADSVAPSPAFDENRSPWGPSSFHNNDLALSRFNASAAQMRLDYRSPNVHDQPFHTDFSFTDFIDNAHTLDEHDQDDEGARMSTLRQRVPSSSTSFSPFVHQGPTGLGIFGAFDNGMPPMSQCAAGQPMVVSQSVPSMGMCEPPSPTSPISVRSSSPYPASTFAHGTMPSVLQSPSTNTHFQHVAGQTTNVRMLPKGVSLFNHFAHLTNPYAGLITKRSRGRRVPNKPEEMNNLGKSGKVYTCKVPGCGKCFKRSEHLKRHVRSIHTDDKPYLCLYPACNKRFSRHDNLNQHARVHITTTSSSDLVTHHLEDAAASAAFHCTYPLSLTMPSAPTEPMLTTNTRDDVVKIEQH